MKRSRSTYLALLAVLLSPMAANADIIIVADVNADSGLGNDQFYLNVLGSSTNVLFGRGNMFGVDGIVSLYSGQGGVTTTVNNTDLSGGVLAGLDLLVFNQVSTWNIPLVYSAAELAAISSFLGSGGDLLLVAEAATSNAAAFASINSFLTGIGSSIQYSGARVGGNTNVVQPHPLTTGVSSFNMSAVDVLTLTGGDAPLVTDLQGNVLVAFEGKSVSVPEPGTLALLSLGLLGLGLSRRKKV